ncbi:MAG: M23 family metallopeptidase [Candidatus Aenigmarchaeota archaeon]|nr:M23 family metallopeptidase [Candidatus Aenigmarchaeota archaeon]
MANSRLVNFFNDISSIANSKKCLLNFEICYKTSNFYSYPVDKSKIKAIEYGKSPAHIGRLIHAVDFMCPVGTPIKAAADGIIVDIKQDSDIGGPDKSFDKHGNYVEIKHEDNEYSIYEHIKKGSSEVKIGDNVKTGQFIAKCGLTGWVGTRGPHVHFDVHRYFGTGPEDYKTLKIMWKK